MRNLLLVVLCLSLLLCAASCGLTAEEEPFSAAFTIRPPESLTEVFFDTSYAGETFVQRDDALDFDALRMLFLDGLFDEQTEHAARWNTPLLYALEGEFTTQDAQVLSDLAMELARVNGFPGMRETTSADANVHISFDKATRPQVLPYTDADGRIRSVQITIPSAYLPVQRSAAVRQYMMRACGFFHTARTTLDSVLAERPASDLREADYILLNILYSGVEAGDDKDACLEAFEQYFAEE
jgi:hypothetical protein